MFRVHLTEIEDKLDASPQEVVDFVNRALPNSDIITEDGFVVSEFGCNAILEEFVKEEYFSLTAKDLIDDLEPPSERRRNPSDTESTDQSRETPQGLTIDSFMVEPTDETPKLSDINGLYHMTHKSHLRDILKHGLLSRNEARRRRLVNQDIANQSVIDNRSRYRDSINNRIINEYAPLYFNPKNPMLSAKRDIQDEIIILEFDPRLIADQNAIFSDGNAGTRSTNFYSDVEHLRNLNWKCIQARYWNDFAGGTRIRMAEVLVYPSVPASKINAVHCGNRRVWREIKAVVENRSGLELHMTKRFYF